VEAASPEAQAPTEAGASVSRLTLIQSAGNTETSVVSFPNPTTAGSLLVAMRPGTSAAPIPVGLSPDASSPWIPVTSASGDTTFVWPNNPGGITSFDIASDANVDVILVEFQAPASIAVQWETDTGNKVNALSVSSTGHPPTSGVELALVYVDCSTDNSISMSAGWSYITTDNNQNYAYWQLTSATPSATATLPMTDDVTMMLVGLQ
jgi:hypothetical protein